MKIHTFEELVEKCNEKNFTLISTKDDYQNCGTKMSYICNKHIEKGVQITTLGRLLEGKGCYYCGREITEKAHRVEFNKNSDKELCEKNNFTYIDTIRDKKIKIQFICNNHKELGVQEMVRYNMKRNIKGCKYCSGKNLPSDYIVSKLNEINPHIELLEDVSLLTAKIKYRCNKHNIEKYTTLQNLLKGKGCYYCGLEKLRESASISQEEYANRISLYNPNVIVIKYNGSHNNSTFQCKMCGHIWDNNSQGIKNKQCPNCQRYYVGEKRISNFLDLNNIEYIPQFKFNDCKDKRPLPFDFYIVSKNTCIEYDGEQHYHQVDGWTDIEITKSHDEIKNKYCNDNNINLIRIPYWDFNNIEIILNKKLINS